jgi:hypothetical protein
VATMMRRGQYWSVLGFSLSIAMTTCLDESPGQSGALNAAIVALLLMGGAGLELVGLHHLMNLAQTAAALWLATSPFALGYGGIGQIGYWHMILGLLLALLGIFHLGQVLSGAGPKKHKR